MAHSFIYFIMGEREHIVSTVTLHQLYFTVRSKKCCYDQLSQTPTNRKTVDGRTVNAEDRSPTYTSLVPEARSVWQWLRQALGNKYWFLLLHLLQALSGRTR